MKSRFHWLIFVGIVAGAALGLALNHWADGLAVKTHIVAICDLLGATIFVGALKMIVAPLIFFSILTAITSLPTAGELKRLGVKTLVFYLATTSIAVAIGLFYVHLIKPGHGAHRAEIRASWQESRGIGDENAAKSERIKQAENQNAFGMLKNTLQNTIMNPFKALAEGQSLGIILFAVLLGMGLMAVGDAGRPAVAVIRGISEAILTLTGWIMLGSPFFIFCLVASLTANLGATVFSTLGGYVMTVLVGIFTHVLALLVLCRVLAKRSPLEFLRGIREAWMLAFATRSSAATLPVTIKCVRDKLNVKEKYADFVLPLGATVNMDGTALYEGVAVIFLIQLFGGLPGAEIALTPAVTGVVFVTAVLASIGAAAVPDAGLVTMVLVANAVGLSAEYIPLIFAVDAFLDMFRTSTNVMGDSLAAVVVERLENKG
jgi:proton glutamate symport protein